MKQLIGVQTALRLLKKNNGVFHMDVIDDDGNIVAVNVIRYLEVFEPENLSKMCDSLRDRFYRTNILKADDAKALSAIVLDELMQHVNGSK